MPEFAKGLILRVTDRDEFDNYVQENADDPGVQMENWGDNSVPEAILIHQYNDDTPSYYRTYDQHVNGELSWNLWNESLIQDMLDAGILEHTGEYDVELVDEQDN